MVRKIVALMILCIFVLGTLEACHHRVPPGQVKKESHRKKH